MYYPNRENKGTDQLFTYCTADLHLCYRIGKNLVFSICHTDSTCTVFVSVLKLGSDFVSEYDPIFSVAIIYEPPGGKTDNVVSEQV